MESIDFRGFRSQRVISSPWKEKNNKNSWIVLWFDFLCFLYVFVMVCMRYILCLIFFVLDMFCTSIYVLYFEMFCLKCFVTKCSILLKKCSVFDMLCFWYIIYFDMLCTLICYLLLYVMNFDMLCTMICYVFDMFCEDMFCKRYVLFLTCFVNNIFCFVLWYVLCLICFVTACFVPFLSFFVCYILW